MNDARLKIYVEQVDNGYKYTIAGPHKLGGERVTENTKETDMLERIGEAVLGYKVKVERK